MLFRSYLTTLKEVCSASGSFIARYGGDEFVVLQKAAAEQDIMHLCATINDELARAEVPYLLRMSIGYARVGDGVDTWQDLLRAADAELYRVKREKKKPASRYARKKGAHDRCDGRAPFLRLWGPPAIRARCGKTGVCRGDSVRNQREPVRSIKLKCANTIPKKVRSLGFFGFVDDDDAAADQQQGNDDGNGARASALAEQQRAQQHAKTGFIKPKTDTRLTGLTASRRDHSE